MDFSVEAACAHSGKAINIDLDSDLNIAGVKDGGEPMFCVPLVTLAKTKRPSIVDIF